MSLTGFRQTLCFLEIVLLPVVISRLGFGQFSDREWRVYLVGAVFGALNLALANWIARG